MAFGLVGVSSTAASTSGDITLTEPAGVASGNLLIASLHFENNDPFTKPAGWNGPYEYIHATANRPSLQLFWIERGGSAPDLTFTRTGGSSASGKIVAYSHTGTLALSGTPVVGPVNSSGATSYSISGLTTTNANDLVFAAVTSNSTFTISTVNATDPGTASGSTDTSTAPTAGTWIRRYGEARSVSSAHAIAGADAVRATAGATGNLTATSGSNTYFCPGIIGFTQGAGGSGDTIDTTEIAANTVYEGAAGSHTVTIAGTHTGATDDIEVQIEDESANVIVAWTTLDTAVAAGAFSGTVSVPRGGWYLARTRKANDTGVSNLQSNRWGVGIVLAMFGQSHMEDLYANGTGSSDDRAVIHNGSAFSLMGTTGAGQCAMAAALTTAADCPVCFIATGVSGTAISYWWSSGKTTPYDTWEAKITAAGGEISAFGLWQGDADAQAGTSKSTYATAIADVFAQIRTDYGASLPIVVVGLGRKSGATDSTWQAIREAHVDAGNNANAYFVNTLDPEQLGDFQHFTDAGLAVIGPRIAQCVAEAYGDASYSRGPVVASATYSGADVDVTLTHDTGTTFTPTTGITGFRVLDNGVAATISSAVRQSATVVRLTCSASLSGPVTVYYGYGAYPTMTAPVVDDTALALPLQSTDGAVTASASGTATDLTVADATHSQAADAATLQVDSHLTAADALHAHTADSATLSTTGETTLTVNDSTHAHSADSIVVTTNWLLVASDSTHAHAVDNATLTIGGSSTNLTVADSMHAHAADFAVLTVSAFLAAQDALHAHTADAVTLSGVDAVQVLSASPARRRLQTTSRPSNLQTSRR